MTEESTIITSIKISNRILTVGHSYKLEDFKDTDRENAYITVTMIELLRDISGHAYRVTFDDRSMLTCYHPDEIYEEVVKE